MVSPPEPVIADHYRVMHVAQLGSGLPEDRIVSTFHMRNDMISGSPTEQAEAMANSVREFYYDGVGAAAPIVGYLNYSPILSAELIVYDLGQPVPREPAARVPVSTADLAKASQAGGPPFEVAACVSWRTAVVAPKTGTPGKTGRGRNYLGPLVNAAMQNSAWGSPLISTTFRDIIKAAALRYIGQGFSTPVVLSKKYAVTDVITGGFIDDAPDTIRSRGQEPKSRTVF